MTGWKKEEGLEFLQEVSSVPLQQSLGCLKENVSNIRRDNLNKITTKLIQENQRIAVETLNVKGMMKIVGIVLNVGPRHDRDVNAASNVLAVGQTALACGATVRPDSCNLREAIDSVLKQAAS